MKKNTLKASLFAMIGIMGLTILCSFTGGGEDKFYVEYFMKDEKTRCKSEPMTLTLPGFTKTGNVWTATSLVVSFGSGSNFAHNCGNDGSLLACQMINCQGVTFETIYKKP